MDLNVADYMSAEAMHRAPELTIMIDVYDYE
jgi:hypothetical protein